MDVKDFDYELPEELIAQDPLEDRSASRLMVLDRETGEIQHRIFKDITEYLRPGDCLVINDTKVNETCGGSMENRCSTDADRRVEALWIVKRGT